MRDFTSEALATLDDDVDGGPKHYYACQICQSLSESNGICSHCGAMDQWISLADDETARRLQELEVKEKTNISVPIWIRVTSWCFATLVFAVLMVVFIVGGGAVVGKLWAQGEWLKELAELLSFMIVFVPGVSAGVGLYSRKWLQQKLSRRFFQPKNEQPLRQLGASLSSHESRTKRAEKTTIEGIAQATGGLLSAPHSQAPCIAYHLKVFLRMPDALLKEVWLLSESRSVAFEVRGTPFLKDRCVVVKEAQLHREERESCPPHFVSFLRERGLFFDENALSIQESIVLDGEEVSILDTGECFLLTTPSLANKVGQLSMAELSAEDGQLSLSSDEGQLSLSTPEP